MSIVSVRFHCFFALLSLLFNGLLNSALAQTKTYETSDGKAITLTISDDYSKLEVEDDGGPGILVAGRASDEDRRLLRTQGEGPLKSVFSSSYKVSLVSDNPNWFELKTLRGETLQLIMPDVIEFFSKLPQS